ncbi:flagellar biosynthesis protein FlaG [Lysinibacillus sp. 2017]|uniref:flagellar protein FlaG n=1 Tax=unclassified Lysinibacillus TaxID=2636778 RepID=UPI000D5258C1|nr:MULTISPECIES: flagellar protein FlaG [unclassified Lysinibacillus]AWE06404.1 flagellar biosynthesis protein FlaG [Lysinibacillus sp. 2017]TGN33410.1 flagellar biosynthesis protein FlaG [Lysinibacillus sp. S2017]
MRIGSQGDLAIQASKLSTPSPKEETVKVETTQIVKESAGNTQQVNAQMVSTQAFGEEQTGASVKEKLDEAVKSINEFLKTQHKSSKFVFHEGLDKYYVQLVDAETDEVIKEIPPEKLLNAFYEMKKQAGMIVDEKI